MSQYLLKSPTKKKAPQSQPIPGCEKDMTRNNAGGYAFKADSLTRLERFLILGSEKGSYYLGESDLTKQNLDNVRACIAQDGAETVSRIANISQSHRAPKNEPALYALALAASYQGDEKTRYHALSVLDRVARTGTDLFTFASYIDTMRGWGPALRRAVGEWYTSKEPSKLAYQLVKYQQRNGWSHRDLLRLAHPKPSMNAGCLKWAIKGWDAVVNSDFHTPTLIGAFEHAKTANETELVRLIKTYGLTREMIPTEHQKSPKVWEALLENMPLGAMIRTLNRMSACGLLAPLSEASKLVVSRLQDKAYLHKAGIHPIKVLAALLTYKTGQGLRGSLTWTPVPQVVDALNDAFYEAFNSLPATRKNFYLGVDVSGSMCGGVVAGLQGLTPNMGAAAMAMLIARIEPTYFIGGFSHKFVDLGISKSDSLDSAIQKCQRDFGGTDCAIAIKHALVNKYPVDCFVVITDGETWAGDQHTSQALQEYRQKMGRDSKLVVINMVANATRITDPTDAGSLDVVGFDASVPLIINEFVGAPVRLNSQDEE